jgi:uncharacterized protein
MNTPSENIAVAQQLYTLFSQRDITGILNILSPNVEWGEPENPYNPAGGTRQGHEGFLQWINIGKEAEDILELNIQKMVADNDTVAVIGDMKVFAKPTRKIYLSDFVHIVMVHDGKITKFQEFFDTYIAGEAFRK